MCPKGTIPDRMKEYCQDIPEQFLRPESGWAIGAMAFSSSGILITLFVVGVFLKYCLILFFFLQFYLYVLIKLFLSTLFLSFALSQTQWNTRSPCIWPRAELRSTGRYINVLFGDFCADIATDWRSLWNSTVSEELIAICVHFRAFILIGNELNTPWRCQWRNAQLFGLK